MSKLIEQLETLPSFSAFRKAVHEKLNIDNFYVNHFAPAQSGYYDEKDDDGRQVCYDYKLSDSQVEDEAIEGLLDDNSEYITEFVTCQLGNEVVELIRDIIIEMRR